MLNFVYLVILFALLAVPLRFCYVSGLKSLELTDPDKMQRFSYRARKDVLWIFLGSAYVFLMYFVFKNRDNDARMLLYPLFAFIAVVSLIPPIFIWSLFLVTGALGALADLILTCGTKIIQVFRVSQ